MHEAVLVHADVDEGSEIGDVGDHAFEAPTGLKVAQGYPAFYERRGLELLTRVASGLVEFSENVLHGLLAEARVGKVLWLELAQKRAVADQRFHRAAARGNDAFDDRIRLGMHGRRVEWIVAVHDAQKSRGLLIRLRPEARDVFDLLAAAKGAVLIAAGGARATPHRAAIRPAPEIPAPPAPMRNIPTRPPPIPSPR